MAQCVIHQHQRRHRFHHRDRTGQYARIMASTGLQRGILEFYIHRILFLHNRCYWFESNLEINCLAVGNPTLNPSRTVCRRSHLPITGSERIVMLSPP